MPLNQWWFNVPHPVRAEGSRNHSPFLGLRYSGPDLAESGAVCAFVAFCVCNAVLQSLTLHWRQYWFPCVLSSCLEKHFWWSLLAFCEDFPKHCGVWNAELGLVLPNKQRPFISITCSELLLLILHVFMYELWFYSKWFVELGLVQICESCVDLSSALSTKYDNSCLPFWLLCWMLIWDRVECGSNSAFMNENTSLLLILLCIFAFGCVSSFGTADPFSV